jgi:DNA-binding response OmpR family regulator
MKHLFRRFHDGAYRRQQVSGTGLGLALTRDLVYLHGGTIDCVSEVGKGTTFVVTLPIRKEAFNESQIDRSHPFEITSPRTTIADLNALGISNDETEVAALPALADDAYRILLVEDNVELLMLMRTLMSDKYHILTAHNGTEALKMIAANPLDLIVTDVMMPGMDGNELTQRIKGSKEWNHLPVIMLTAKTSEEDRKQSMLIGADDYIAKPFKLGDLELRINNMVENRRRILRERQLAAAQMADGGETTEAERPLTADEEFLNRAYQCVLTHLSDSEFNRDAFAADMGASPSTLYNRLRALTGMNVSSYIRDIRMKEARRLAEASPDMRVSDLAYKVGFNDPKYFATCFKKEFGVQPSEFLKSN